MTPALPDSASAHAVFARVAGSDRGVPWRGAAASAAALAAARLFAAPLLSKLMLAMLAPVLAGFLAGWLSRVTRRGGQGWLLPWFWAGFALALGLVGAAAVHRFLLRPDELVLFTQFEILALALLSWAGALALPLALAQRQAYRDELAALRISALSSELKALQAQVEPHFLYNTLANTRYLARHRPAQAVEMLDHLIAYLHQALPDMRSRASSVRRECDLAGHYLALMAIRFGERLRYAVEVDESVLDAEMPPLLLISLVENAVRHGVEPMPGSVNVRLRAARDNGRLRLEVADDGPGPGLQGPTGSGVGLRNARARLRALYGEAASLQLTRGADAHTRAELLLPLSFPLSPT